MLDIKSKLNQCILGHEYDLVKDQPLDGVLHFNFINKDWCRDLISLAETNGEWTTDRHKAYPTHDMLLRVLDENIDQEYVNTLEEYIKPMLIDEFGLEGPEVKNSWWYETFIAKYSPDLQSRLSLHHDASDLSTVLTLNDEFEGGGTYFSRQKKLVRGDVGEMTVHPGKITHRHGGRPVTEGTRYILVTFINFNK